MSVAIIIKNTILVILIILIGHFMVKNFLLDKKQKTTSTHKTEPNKDIGGALVPVKGELAPSPIVPETETPTPKPSSDAISTVQGGLDKAKEELLKFIDDEDENDNVERFFGKETILATQPDDNCKPRAGQEMHLPLSTTCDPTVQSFARTDKPIKTSGTASCQSQKNVVMLNEYDNESTMNGGELFGGLSAFDNFDNHFQPL